MIRIRQYIVRPAVLKDTPTQKRVMTMDMSVRFITCFFILVWVTFSMSTPMSHGGETSLNAAEKGNGRSLKNLLTELSPKGWVLVDEVRYFVPERLWEQIDGQAELFLSYEVRSLTVATYENSANPNRFVDVLIYDMGNPTNAFGIFSVEKRRQASDLMLGRMGYRMGSNYYVWKGSHYVQIVSSDYSDELKRIGMDFLTQVVDILPDRGEEVRGLSILSTTGIIPGSIQYFRKNAFGLDFLETTYAARFRLENKNMTVFLTLADHPSSVTHMIEAYETYAGRFGESVQKKQEGGTHVLIADMGDGYDVILQKGQKMGGVLSVAGETLALKAATEFWKQIHQNK